MCNIEQSHLWRHLHFNQIDPSSSTLLFCFIFMFSVASIKNKCRSCVTSFKHLYIICEWCVKTSIVIIQFYFFSRSESKTLKLMHSRLSLYRPILSRATLQNHFPNSIYLLYVILFGIYCLWISRKQISIIYIPIRVYDHCRVCSTLFYNLLPKNSWRSGSIFFI